MLPNPQNSTVRQPAVAGLFYPCDATELTAVVGGYLDTAAQRDVPTPPKALIVPHAGYVYSGIVAAAAYSLVATYRQRIRRVVLIGPSHRVRLQGIAVPHANVFATPLGAIPLDRAARAVLLARGDIVESDVPHEPEHSLEVQLPFLQTVLDDFALLPLVVGRASASYVADILATVWGGEETLVVASSDLSHYHTYDEGRRIDATTCEAILERRTDLTGDQACGAAAINGLLQLAHERQAQITELMRLNSGDTGGDRSRVVGYGAFAIHGAR